MLRSPAPEILQDPLVPQPRESNAFARPIGQTLTSGSGTEPKGALEANTLSFRAQRESSPLSEPPERPQARSRGAPPAIFRSKSPVPQTPASNEFARPIRQTLSGSGTEPEGALETNKPAPQRAARKPYSLSLLSDRRLGAAELPPRHTPQDPRRPNPGHPTPPPDRSARPLSRNDLSWIGRAGCIFFRKSFVVRSLRASMGPRLALASSYKRICWAITFLPTKS